MTKILDHIPEGWKEIKGSVTAPDVPDVTQEHFEEKNSEKGLVTAYSKIYNLPEEVVTKAFRIYPRKGSNIEMFRLMRERRAYLKGYSEGVVITPAKAKEIVKAADRLIEEAKANMWNSDEY